MEHCKTSNALDSPPRRTIFWGRTGVSGKDCDASPKRKPEIRAAQVSSKYDGTRVKIVKKDGVVTLINRHGIDYTHRLTEIVDAAKAIKGDFTIDTEAVFINTVTKEVEFTPCQALLGP